MAGYTIEANHRNVHTLRIPFANRKEWEQWFLLAADLHTDNPHTQRELIHKHFRQAKDRGAGILLFGDVFCAMQGKDDKRGSKSDVRPEDNFSDYFDRIVDSLAAEFQPYASNIVMISEGNHETGVTKKKEINVTNRLIKEIQYRTGHAIQKGGYSGFIRFMFNMGDVRDSYKLYYHHGAGGGGYASRGTLGVNRKAIIAPDADIIVSGHIHEAWQMETVRHRINPQGKPYLDTQYHIQLPTYKEEYDDGYGGYHIENGRPPKPLGGWWVRFYMEEKRIQFEIIRAK